MSDKDWRNALTVGDEIALCDHSSPGYASIHRVTEIEPTQGTYQGKIYIDDNLYFNIDTGVRVSNSYLQRTQYIAPVTDAIRVQQAQRDIADQLVYIEWDRVPLAVLQTIYDLAAEYVPERHRKDVAV